MTTFEEKYRRKTGLPPSAADTQAPSSPSASGAMDLLKDAAKEEYKAFNGSAHPETDLWVRTSDANANADVGMPYGYRNHMIYDGAGFVISMHFGTPIISVTLHGRNMHDLWRKLLKREVEWVMEYDPKAWDAPAEGVACITGIEIKRKPLPESDEESRPEIKAPESTATH